jgi:hypothetical protein
MVKVVEELANILLPQLKHERVAYSFFSLVRELAGKLGEDEYAANQRLREWRMFMQDPYLGPRMLTPSAGPGIPSKVTGDVVSGEASGDVEPGEGEAEAA